MPVFSYASVRLRIGCCRILHHIEPPDDMAFINKITCVHRGRPGGRSGPDTFVRLFYYSKDSSTAEGFVPAGWEAELIVENVVGNEAKE